MSIFLSTLTIKVSGSPGCDIKDVITEMIKCADHLRIWVECDCNNITVMAKPGDNPDDLYEQWLIAFDSKSQFKFACTHAVRQE